MSEPPLLQVLRGEPSDTEVAALTAVLTARAAASVGGDSAEPARSEWSRGSGVRRPLPAPGPGAWRASGQPR